MRNLYFQVVPPCAPSRARGVSVVALLLGLPLLGMASLAGAAVAEPVPETIQLRNGDRVEGVLLRADLNIAVARRAIGGLQMMPTSEIAELHLAPPGRETIIFRFDDWVQGAYEIERGGRVIPIEHYVEPPVVANANANGAAPAADGAADGVEVAAADASGLPTLSVNAGVGFESDRALTVTFELSQPAAESVLLVYTTSDGTAVAGRDYEPLAGVLTFEPGVRTAELEVPLIDNDQADQPRTIKLIVNADPTRVDLDGLAPVELTIEDDD